MGVFDTKTNIKKDFTVGDFYTLEVVNLGMSKSLEEEAQRMLKVPFPQMKSELLSTPLKKFKRLFSLFTPKKVINPYGYYVYIDFEEVRVWMLKRFLRKWVKKEYRSGYNKPYCYSGISYLGEENHTKYIHIYNGELIECSSEANMMLMFIPK